MNDIKMSVGIVTFRQRAELVKELIYKLRSYIPESCDIILVINGNNEEDMTEEYRQDMLDLAKKYKNIYPIFCPEFKGLSKLWNNIVIFSKTEYNIILCDDVVFDNPKAYQILQNHIKSTNQEFFTFGHCAYGFSHFVCTKSIMHKLGYFDERLCGFGEEDGDIIHRYIKMFGHNLPGLQVPYVYNKAAYDLKNDNIECHQDNKPKFNRELAKIFYIQDTDGVCGMSPTPITKVVHDHQQYPYEEFIRKNKHNIGKFNKVVF